jgi:MFS family permease
LLQGATSIFRFISGVLSDRYRNRKGFVFFGYALSSVARPLLALFGSFGAIAALRTIDGAGKGMKDAPRDALVADSSVEAVRGRAFGFHRLIDTAGSVLGPLVAAAILISLSASRYAYHIVFGLAVIPGSIALILIWFGLREPKVMTQLARKPFTWKFPWTFWVFTLGTTVAMLTKINDSLFLVRAHTIGIPVAWIPVLFAGFTLLYALMSYPIGIWSDKFGRLPFLLSGWLVLGLVEFGFSYDPSLAGALVLFAGFGLFYALTEGSGRAFISDLVPPENRGSAYAIFQTLTGLAVIVGGYGLGKVWEVQSSDAAFRISAVGSVIGFAVLLLMWLYRRRQPVGREAKI